jgi:hypothetical protein
MLNFPSNVYLFAGSLVNLVQMKLYDMNGVHSAVYEFTGEMNNTNITGGLPDSLYPNFPLLYFNSNNFI